VEGPEVTQPKDIIKTLRDARRDLAINQHDLALHVGYDRVTIAKYECGYRVPPQLQMLCNWAEALGHELVLVKK
jgi:transcriptional regulator with XRE-family HTH domain